MTKKLERTIEETNDKVLEKSTPFSILLLEFIVGSALIIGLVFIFFEIREEILEKEFELFDMQLLHFFYNLRTPILNAIMKIITDFGATTMIVLWVGLIIVLSIKKYVREAVLLGFVLSMAAIINGCLKLIFQRPRPQFEPLVIENSYSFPSGHAMDSTVFYLMLVYLTYHLTRNKKLTVLVGVIASFMILAIGISRIYLGVHYPSDVLAGFVAGLCWLLIVFFVYKTIWKFRLFSKKKPPIA